MKTAIIISILVSAVLFLSLIAEGRSEQSERPIKSIAICYITMDEHGNLKAEILHHSIGLKILFINGLICNFVGDHWLKDGTCRLCGAVPHGLPSNAMN